MTQAGTPLEMLSRLRGLRRPFLLESGSDADGCGRFSFAGCDPVAVLEWRLGDGGDPLRLLEQAAAERPCIAVGFLGYGLASLIEPRVPPQPDPLGFPELAFALYDAVWRLDHATGRADILGPGAAALAERLAAPPASPATLRVGPLSTRLDAREHARRLGRILEYIHAGDVYQVNLTHRLCARAQGDPAALYEAVRRFGAPFGAYLDLGAGRTLVANSPERFLHARAGRIESRPIKGTRAPGPGAADALAADPKERAEHVMIVDLVRNDLGRVCKTGTVAVDGLFRVVRYPTLHHMISTVAGVPRAGLGLADLLHATFPGGSITGAPKVRAMQIIAELEPEPRGLYTGAFGRIGPGPGLDLDLAMAIRTAACTPGRIDLGVGGAIVADSRPEAEWAESLLKARAFALALGDLASLVIERDDADGQGSGPDVCVDVGAQ
ncbi:MAG TPA: anthranilate synthase component I family protein [Polyangia bacterium]|nr:anthranilate synthase component I family protein [Polyangia bacterium]